MIKTIPLSYNLIKNIAHTKQQIPLYHNYGIKVKRK